MGTVDEYLESLDPGDRAVVSHVFDVVRETLPDVEQGKSYGMPALLYRGKALIAVMRTKKHIGVYPFSGRVPEVVAEGLPEPEQQSLEFDKGTIRFQPERPLPDDTIRAIVAARVAEIEDPSLRKR
ncbi:iron chaperone [Microbacterium sp. NPDC056044]|uniref:iron chaperone n=1 Tax=Microbacterium sp. NPDC056044 TaxID=3345690 RepID=UPI0035DF12BD